MKQTTSQQEISPYVSLYEQKALDFMAKTGTTMQVIYLKTGKHFNDDTEERDIYTITINKGNRSYSFNFGQSIVKSGEYVFLNKHLGRNTLQKDRHFLNSQEYKKLSSYHKENIIVNKEYSKPTAYDILACIMKYDPGTFENFCSEFGYDTDSRKAGKIYDAVIEEWLNVSRLFNDDELSEMMEIN